MKSAQKEMRREWRKRRDRAMKLCRATMKREGASEDEIRRALNLLELEWQDALLNARAKLDVLEAIHGS